MNGRLSEDNQTLIVTVLMTGRPDVRGFRCEVYSNQPPYEGSHYQKVTVTGTYPFTLVLDIEGLIVHETSMFGVN